MKRIVVLFVLLVFATSFAYADDVPSEINYQGYVTSGGSAYGGTSGATGYFKFALVNSAGTTTYWSNDGTSVEGSEPTDYVSTTVSSGVFNIILGNTSETGHMHALDKTIFSNGVQLYLRVWFCTTAAGTYEKMTTDKKITASGYAINCDAFDNTIMTSLTLDSDNTGSGNTIQIIAEQGSDNNGIIRYYTTTDTWQYSNDGTTFTNFASGTGDVTGPGSSMDNDIARFDGFTGKIIQDSGVTVSDANVIAVATGDITIQSSMASSTVNLTAGLGGDVNLTAGLGGDVNVPASVGMTFGDDGEKIEGNGTKLVINSSEDLDLTATSDVNVPASVGMTFGDDGEKIEGDGTDLTISSSGDLLLAATGADISSNAPITFSSGVVMTAASYQIGRNADATNLMAFNVPTDASFEFSVNDAAELTLNVDALTPATTGGLALGTTALKFSNLFLNNNGVINWNASNVTLTHSSNLLTLAGGGFQSNLGATDKVYINGTTTRTDTTEVLDIEATIDTTTATDDVPAQVIKTTRASGDTGGTYGIVSSVTTGNMANAEWSFNYGGAYNTGACTTGTSNAAVFYANTPTVDADCNDYGIYVVSGYDYAAYLNGSIGMVLPAAGQLVIDAAATDNTTATGVINMDVDSSTTGNIGLSLDYQDINTGASITEYASKIDVTIDANPTGDDTVYGQYIGITQSDTGATAWGAYVTGEDSNYFSGKVGIGETNPSYKVAIKDASTTDGSRALNVQQTGVITGSGYGIYVEKKGASTTSIGGYFTAKDGTYNYALITGSGGVVYTPSATQSITGVDNTISANAGFVVLDPNGNYTLTSAPTVTAGADGQILYITVPHGETNVVTVQEGAGTTLYLAAATRAIGAGDVLVLISRTNNWFEVSYSNNE